MIHELKCWPEYYYRIFTGQKTFEVRKNDRPIKFEIGDHLRIREFNPENNEYTGRECVRIVEYILHGGQFGIEEGFCVMAMKSVNLNNK